MVDLEKESLVNKLTILCDFMNALMKMNSTLLREPIQNKKWSTIDTVAHLQFWDKYLLDRTIPSVRETGIVTFPDHDEYNQKAVRYAKNNTVTEILFETINYRQKLIQVINSENRDVLSRHVTVNGYSNCPNTELPYTLALLIKEFTDHDTHHIKKINKKLQLEDVENYI